MDFSDFSSLELKEFYSFLSKISNFEKIYQIQSDSLIFILWGALFLLSAISETIMNFNPSFNISLLVWVVALLLGGLLTVTIENQITFFGKKTFNLFDRLLLVNICLLVLINVVCQVLFRLNYLIFPLLGMQFFLFTFFPTRSYVQHNPSFISTKITSLIPFSALASSLCSLFILLFFTTLLNNSSTIDPFYFSNFESLIFALFIGPALILSGLLNNKKINEFFLSLQTESDEQT